MYKSDCTHIYKHYQHVTVQSTDTSSVDSGPQTEPPLSNFWLASTNTPALFGSSWRHPLGSSAMKASQHRSSQNLGFCSVPRSTSKPGSPSTTVSQRTFHGSVPINNPRHLCFWKSRNVSCPSDQNLRYKDTTGSAPCGEEPNTDNTCCCHMILISAWLHFRKTCATRYKQLTVQNNLQWAWPKWGGVTVRIWGTRGGLEANRRGGGYCQWWERTVTS